MEDFALKCWLTLKARHPRLRKRMDDIEISLVGLLPPRTTSPRKNKDDKEPDEELGEVV